jgi:hypothetical protein
MARRINKGAGSNEPVPVKPAFFAPNTWDLYLRQMTTRYVVYALDGFQGTG